MKILFTGDSLTDGNRYKLPEQEWDKNHQIGHSYAYVINALLGSAYPGRYEFINRGVSGNRIADILERVDRDLLAHEPDVVSILVGVNDGAGDGVSHTPYAEFEASYRALLDKIRGGLPECKIIICGAFVERAGTLREQYENKRACVDAYAAVEKFLAREYGAVFIDLQSAFDEVISSPYPEYWMWDGIHPTENGHGIIARRWLEAFGEPVAVK